MHQQSVRIFACKFNLPAVKINQSPHQNGGHKIISLPECRYHFWLQECFMSRRIFLNWKLSGDAFVNAFVIKLKYSKILLHGVHAETLKGRHAKGVKGID